jgi:hypothetical protein
MISSYINQKWQRFGYIKSNSYLAIKSVLKIVFLYSNILNLKTMNYKTNLQIIFAIILTCLIVYSCKKDKAANQPPVINSLTISSTDVDFGDTCSISADATDPEDDELKYVWNCPNGAVIPGSSANAISWIAPSIAGNYPITIIISDEENMVEKSDTIKVSAHPILSVDKSMLSFESSLDTISFHIKNTGTGSINWTISTTNAWVKTISPSSGATLKEDKVLITIDRTGLATGNYNGLLTINSNAGNTTVTMNMEVLPPADFSDDFSAGEDQWAFTYCNHSITSGELSMTPNVSGSSGMARHYFSTTMELPWTYSANLKVNSGSDDDLIAGLYINLNDEGTLQVSAMMLCVVKNSTSGFNWFWFWYVPSITMWVPYDASCRGNSSAVNTAGGVNKLEMIANSNKTFTLKCNGTNLLTSYNAIQKFETSESVSVTLGAEDIGLRNFYGFSTKWDNVSFNSETTTLSAQKYSNAAIPTKAEVQEIINSYQSGKITYLKDLLKK